MLMGLLLPNFFIFNKKKEHIERCPIIFNCQLSNHIVLGLWKIAKLKKYYVSCAYVHPASHSHPLVESELFYINNLLLTTPRG